MSEERSTVSVVVVAFNEEKQIRDCLETLLRLDYPSEKLEILVIDNNSTDGTREVVGHFSRQHANFRLIVNRIKGIAASRNVGLREAKNDLVAFTDADCTVSPDWLSNLEEALRQARLENVKVVVAGGSSICPPRANRFRQALGIAVQNFWGNHGSVQGRLIKTRTYVEHLPALNLLCHRECILAEGGFDESMGNIAEDLELSQRLNWLGYKLLYVPDAAVYHIWRTDLRSWMRNMILYGKGRSWLVQKDRRSFKFIFLVPVGLLLCTIAAPFISFAPLFLVPGVYFFLTILMSVAACFKARRLDLVFAVFWIYVVTHYSYGIGEMLGLFTSQDCRKAPIAS